MADYIDREKTEEAIQSLTIVDATVAAYAEAVLFILRRQPSADVAPVIHARWVDWGVRDDNGNGEYTCSYCDHIDEHPPGRRIPYCWYCGAKMDMNKEGE